MGKSLSSDSARAGSQKQQKEASRRAAPDARERIPAPAERLGPIISTVHTNESTLTRNKGLLVSPFLELFLDRSGSALALVATARPRQGRRSRSPRIARPSPRRPTPLHGKLPLLAPSIYNSARGRSKASTPAAF